MVLVPATPGATKSTHCKGNPLTVMVDDVTLSPAKPAAREKSRKNPIQWAGVYRSKILFSAAASVVPNFSQVSVALDADGAEHEYSPEAFTMTSALADPLPVGVSVKARPFGGSTA